MRNIKQGVLIPASLIITILVMPLYLNSEKAIAENPTEVTIIRNVLETGVRLNSNQTTYILISGEDVGPAQCASTLLKADLNNPQMAGAEDMIRKMLIAAHLGNRKVKIAVSMTECVHGNPTFKDIRLVN